MGIHWYGRAPAYIHVRFGHATIYNGPAIDHLELNPMQTPRHILDSRLAHLRESGWELGVDGWRAPLDPNGPFIATAHIIPAASALVKARR